MATHSSGYAERRGGGEVRLGVRLALLDLLAGHHHARTSRAAAWARIGATNRS